MSDRKATPIFKKSSASGVTKNLCVEVAIGDNEVLVRNSTAREAVIAFTTEEWSAFVAGVKLNEFDA